MEPCRHSSDGDTLQYCSFSLIKFLLKAMVKWSLILCVYVCIVIRANAKEVMVFISSFKKKKQKQK